jgi:hypothetical protein
MVLYTLHAYMYTHTITTGATPQNDVYNVAVGLFLVWGTGMLTMLSIRAVKALARYLHDTVDNTINKTLVYSINSVLLSALMRISDGHDVQRIAVKSYLICMRRHYASSISRS